MEDRALAEARYLLEIAWGVIANAHGGDWTLESKEWQDAAGRWRDQYFASLGQKSNVTLISEERMA
jgi:hypothetical protein